MGKGGAAGQQAAEAAVGDKRLVAAYVMAGALLRSMWGAVALLALSPCVMMNEALLAKQAEEVLGWLVCCAE